MNATAPTTAGAFNPAFNGQVSVVGDVTGQFTGDAGMVQLTAYTTNDKTAPSATTLLNLNGKSNLAFSNIMFTGGNAVMVTATTAASQNISFRDCAFLSGFTGGPATMIQLTTAFSIPPAWMIDRCSFFTVRSTAGSVLTLLITASATGVSDYDITSFIQNCVMVTPGSTSAAILINGAALTFKGGGLRIRNCYAAGQFVGTTAGQLSTIFPCYVYNSFLNGGSGATPITAGTTGHVIEDYNLIVATTPRANITAGAHSVSDGSYAPLFQFGQERIWNALLRPFGEPMSASPLLGFGNDGGQTLYDLYNRPRPAGGGSGFPFPAAGALERGNTSTQGDVS